jgi:hypothetical protein
MPRPRPRRAGLHGHLLLLLLPVAARGDEPAAGGGAGARGRAPLAARIFARRGVRNSLEVNRLQNHIEMTMTI